MSRRGTRAMGLLGAISMIVLVFASAAAAAEQAQQQQQQQQQPAYASMWAAIQGQDLKALGNFIQGDVKAALQNPKLAACTLFAPTDDAFYSMLNVRIPGIDVRSYMNNRAVLSMVANLHLVPGAHPTSQMSNGQKLQSRLAGSAGALTIDKSGAQVHVQSAGSAPQIVRPDIRAGANGVMHVINGMLVPVRLPGLAGSR